METQLPCLVGEWSCALPPESLGGRTGLALDAAMRAYGDAQLINFDATRGWFFWTLKTEEGGALELPRLRAARLAAGEIRPLAGFGMPEVLIVIRAARAEQMRRSRVLREVVARRTHRTNFLLPRLVAEPRQPAERILAEQLSKNPLRQAQAPRRLAVVFHRVAA